MLKVTRKVTRKVTIFIDNVTEKNVTSYKFVTYLQK